MARLDAEPRPDVSDPDASRAGPEPEQEQDHERLRDIPIALWLLVIAIVANIFSGNSDKLGLPISLDRLAFPLALGLIALTPKRAPLRFRAIHVLMLAFAALTAFSGLASGSLPQTAPLFALLDRVVMPFLLFTAVPLVVTTPRRARILLGTLTVVGAYLAVVTVLEAAHLERYAWPGYIAAAKGVQLTTSSTVTARAGGPFLAAEANGEALLLCGIAALLLAHLSRRIGRGPTRPVALLTAPLCAVASILTMTRSIWLALILAAVVVVATTRSLWRYVPVALGVAAVIAVFAVVLLPDLTSAISERGTMASSVYDRQNTNAAAVRIVTTEPLTGIGWGRFVHDGADWVRQDPRYPLTNVNIEVHNVFLSRAAELGLPAAAIFVAIVVLGPAATALRRVRPQVRSEVRPWRLGLLAMVVTWLTVSMTSPNPYPFPNYVLWMVAGIVAQIVATGRLGAADRAAGAGATSEEGACP